MNWSTITTGKFQFILLFCACVFISTSYGAPFEIILEPPDNLALPASPVTLHEDTTDQEDLVIIKCNVTTCTCNLIRTQPTNGPFDVWWLPTLTEFRGFFVGTTQATEQLDYSSIRTYYMFITCVDGTDQVSTTVEVDILPNRQPTVTGYPAVTTATFTGNSDDPVGTLIYQVTASDLDKDALKYTMTQNPDKGYFQISESDGDITTAVDMRTIVDESIILTVTVSDYHGNSVDLLVTVKFTDLNTRPFISNLPVTIQVNEDEASGYLLTTLTFDDATPQPGTLEPVCTTDPVAEDSKFPYDTGTRKIKLTTASTDQTLLDYEATIKYTITCTVSDGYLSSVDDVLTVEVVNINEPPVFDQSIYYCFITESKANVEHCELGITVVDPEDDTIRTMELQSIGNSDRFFYNRNKDTLTFAVDYDVDQSAMPTTDTVVLLAVDSHKATGSATISIVVADANDNACTFGTQQAAQFTVHNGDTFKTLGSVIGSDIDLTSPNNQISFEVVDGFPAESVNYLQVYNSGEIKYVGLIPEVNHGMSYSLKIICKDGGSPAQISTGTVQVSYYTTTTTTTSTSTTTTTTPTTTSTTTTTEKSIWDEEGFVAVFATLMALLCLALLVGLWFCCTRVNPQMMDCCNLPPRTPPRQVEPYDKRYRQDDDDMFLSGHTRSRPDYVEQAWRTVLAISREVSRNCDHYENGIGYNPRGMTPKSDIFITSSHSINRPKALPPPGGRDYYL